MKMQIKYILKEENAINYIYPNGMMSINEISTKMALLAVTNKEVDECKSNGVKKENFKKFSFLALETIKKSQLPKKKI